MLTEIVELTERTLPAEPWVYGVVAFGILMGLGLVAAAFRSVWTRH